MYILIVVLGIALVAFGLSRLAAYARARTWPATGGRLTELSVASAAERILYSNLEYTYPIIRYGYTVNSVGYTGDRVSVEPRNAWVPNDKKDRAPWARWQVGTELTVHYHPHDPSQALLLPALSPRRRSHLLSITVAGALLILAGVAIGTLRA
jgi:hypothetical protein